MEDLAQLGQRAQQASYSLGLLSTMQKNQVLLAIATALTTQQDEILAANAKDLENPQVPEKFVDRLRLTADRIEAMATGLKQVVALPDPIGNVDRAWRNEAGLMIAKERVPLGVIGMIFEARPNVTVDASALCFKTGNAVILRGGKEAIHSNQALVQVLRGALRANDVDENAIQLITDTSHATAEKFMQLTDYVDVLIPRGSARLIQTVLAKATVPVIETGAGNCHVYVDKDAQLQMATDIVINGKVQRPSVCNATEKLLIHQDVAAAYLPSMIQALRDQGVEVRGDQATQAIVPDVVPATDADWGTEYNDLIIAVKVVDSEAAAIAHINRYNTQHSEAIVTDNYQAGKIFQQRVNAACVYINASTRFTDGFEFGFGAEIGISTQKLHARGPMGLAELTSYKYVIDGNGQVRH
ncbi:glutamate-5-semialdehyde dehydrogenase [Lactiplantibacillus pentosus]|uniref:Gamma-glutamyl phosphate reductase n=1 Tax=Lactiplantibacillus pentosus IG1 TaxID=1042160 RepID=G0M4E0_LACPE|nr:glutamate-5-semialdehyde dehydrogenase [Lactiplantibacillus pentosus]CCC17059.1 gamma-glutamyl phosphate reductase (GPR) [Lactiplantibacillus pentosus IG1]MCT3301463.1 glutamate-5-semialdehyde dehydrogenase [Lactiplantibacillus pentosus]PRO79999.1 glutamate-5-semialdehyde dehydrogenase [Lactiplantibacillus pentosus]PRO82764.1 glutamate-5-semialdehyde dehydrogenase [Lactiplantibacillus pentosus]PRO93126.1 glutamate-5-semialdehyde dehydrogenase [Lactiplantibacillus pentosus]